MAWRFHSLGGALWVRRESTGEEFECRVESEAGAEFRCLVGGHAVALAGGAWRAFCRCEKGDCWHVRAANALRRLGECIDAQRAAADARDRAARSVPVVLAEAEAEELDPVFEVPEDEGKEDCP